MRMRNENNNDFFVNIELNVITLIVHVHAMCPIFSLDLFNSFGAPGKNQNHLHLLIVIMLLKIDKREWETGLN